METNVSSQCDCWHRKQSLTTLILSEKATKDTSGNITDELGTTYCSNSVSVAYIIQLTPTVFLFQRWGKSR